MAGTVVDTGGSGSYPSLAAAISGEAKDLSGGGVFTIECQSTDGSADTAATVTGFTNESSSDYVRIYTEAAHRHSGTYPADKYRIEGTNYLLTVSDPFTRVEGVCIKHVNQASDFYGALRVTVDDVQFNDGIITQTGATANEYYGVRLDTFTGAFTFFESIITGFLTVANNTSGFNVISACSPTISSCVIFGNKNGIRRGSGTVNVINSVIANNTDDLLGTINSLTYCAGDDADFDSGTGNIGWASEATNWAANFTDYSNGDFSVKDTNADIYHTGSNAALKSSEDIVGTAWNNPPSIGAFEFVAGAPTANNIVLNIIGG